MVVFNRLDPAITRIGLDHKSLRKINPKAIAVLMTAFKGERPASFDPYPGYDPILQAQTGIMTRFGWGKVRNCTAWRRASTTFAAISARSVALSRWWPKGGVATARATGRTRLCQCRQSSSASVPGHQSTDRQSGCIGKVGDG